jgi:hypothetical protein
MASPVIIQVFILQTQATNAKASNVARLFSYSSVLDSSSPTVGRTIDFNVTTLVVSSKDPSTSSTGSNKPKISPDAAEYNAVRGALATHNLDGKYIIFCLDTTISASSPETIYYTIKDAVNLNYVVDQDWDLCYLCKWMDNCSVYTDIKPNVGDSNAKIVKTQSPFGFQSVMFSPTGASKLTDLMSNIGTFNKPLNLTLHDQVSLDIWSSIALSPNLMAFDPSMARPGTMDYVRTNECRDPTPIQTPFKDSNLSFFWFLVVVIIVIILVWVCLRLGVIIDQNRGQLLATSRASSTQSVGGDPLSFDSSKLLLSSSMMINPATSIS